MPLTNLNPLDPSTAYLTERNNLLKRWENDPLFTHRQNNTVTAEDLRVHLDSRKFLAIGYGLDLLHNNPQAIADYFIAANIQLLNHTGVGLSQADLNLITDYQADPFNVNMIQALLNGFPPLPREPDATALLNVRAAGAENQLDQILGFHMGESRERAALASLAYNNASALLGPKLIAAIQTDNRAEAWYQIRYASNGGASQSDGIANRRIAESTLFGLYDNSGLGVGEAEAKEVLRMYTIHRPDIQTYESDFRTIFPSGGVNAIQSQLTAAKSPLIATYALGHTIDGEVLVGQDADIPGDKLVGTTQNDLLFGEKGHDELKGGAHIGITKTYNYVKKYYFWPRMLKDIKSHVKKCEMCKMTKSPNSCNKVLMGIMKQAHEPFELISLDYITHFSRSKKGNKVLLVISDYFTKYVKLFPVKDATVKHLCHILDNEIF